MRPGFSLVELSIVLVILGLLTGGILAGQSLIHAAEMRAITTELNRYVAATNSFRDKYFALPGDMTNATSFWGLAAPNSSGQCTNSLTATGTGTQTCNGNGNGKIVGTERESYRYWQQLQNAGLLEGALSGYSRIGFDNGNGAEPGFSTPATKSSGTAAWHITWGSTGDVVPDALIFQASAIGAYGHFFSLGNPWGYIINLLPFSYGSGPPFKAEDAWNIDTKIDDGKPAGGKVLGSDWDYCTNAASNTDTAAAYDLQSSGKVCSLIFRNMF